MYYIMFSQYLAYGNRIELGGQVCIDDLCSIFIHNIQVNRSQDKKIMWSLQDRHALPKDWTYQGTIASDTAGALTFKKGCNILYPLVLWHSYRKFLIFERGIIYKWPVFRSYVKFPEGNNDQMKSTEKMIPNDPLWSTTIHQWSAQCGVPL